jgi:hypothetical protein
MLKAFAGYEKKHNADWRTELKASHAKGGKTNASGP